MAESESVMRMATKSLNETFTTTASSSTIESNQKESTEVAERTIERERTNYV
jgi:hypothetical protein